MFSAKRILIVGIGLMGSSLARALKEHNQAIYLIGMDTNADDLRIGITQNWLDEIATPETASVVDMVVLCTPPDQLATATKASLPYIGANTAITDTASVKRVAVQAITTHVPNPARYIPSHPIAGSTASGAALGKADLYEGRKVMLCPEMGVDINDPAYVMVREMWEAVGAELALIPADVHDLVYAYVSHLPQLVGFAAHKVLRPLVKDESYCDNEILRRFLRLGGSPAPLWNSIFLHNDDYVLQALRMYLAFAKQMIDEFEQGAAAAEKSEPSDDAITKLFPRIVASCLVMSLAQLEQRAKLKLASFAGAGFADMAAPALETPEEDIEKISGSYQQIQPLLSQMVNELEALAQMLENQQKNLFASAIERLAA